jgi:glycosyltransferase involved in cell wall biosynthesis
LNQISGILFVVKNVLAIAYHYPPIASPGAERMRAFARDLLVHGYRLLPVTTSTYGVDGSPDVLRIGEPVGLFRSLLNAEQKAASVDVRSRIRTDAGVLSRVVGWVRDRVMIPDGQIAWCVPAFFACLAEIRRSDVRAIYTSSPPHSAHLLGLMLKRATGLPWVAEFRDVWTHDPVDVFLREGSRRLAMEQTMERAVAIEADALVGVTERACDYIGTLAGADKVTCVSNGFDRTRAPRIHPSTTLGINSDAKKDKKEENDGVAESNDEVLRLAHIGSFSASHPLRSPDVLVRAVASFGEEVELTLVGPLTSGEKDRVEQLGDGNVRMTGMVAREEAGRFQHEADVLVLVDHARTHPSTNVPSKCYEYLAAGKPILAMTPVGATRDLLDEVGGAVCVDPADEEGVRGAIGALVEGKREGRLGELVASEEKLGMYRREVLAGELAGVFDGVTD